MLKESNIEKIFGDYCDNIQVFQQYQRTALNKYNVIYLYVLHIVSLFLSFLVSKFKYKETIYFSWSNTHRNKLKIFSNDIFEINFSKFDFNKCSLYSIIKFKDLICIFNIIKNLKYPLYLKILFIFEYTLVFNIIEKSKIIFISGHFDRIVVLISLLSKTDNKKLNIVQHGALELIDNLPKIYVSKVYYMYDFSVDYFNRNYLPLEKNIFYEYEPNLISDKNNFKSCNLKNKTIAFITQPDNLVKNYKILDYLIKEYHEFNISIIVHPRDRVRHYRDYISDNIIFSRDFCLNYNIVFTRFSTLGINFHEKGIETVFINLDGVKMDFIESGNYRVFNSFKDYKKV